MVNYDYLYDKEYFKNDFDKDYFVKDKVLTFKNYRNAYVVPAWGYASGVYTDSGEFINYTDMHNSCGGVAFTNW